MTLLCISSLCKIDDCTCELAHRKANNKTGFDESSACKAFCKASSFAALQSSAAESAEHKGTRLLLQNCFVGMAALSILLFARFSAQLFKLTEWSLELCVGRGIDLGVQHCTVGQKTTVSL